MGSINLQEEMELRMKSGGERNLLRSIQPAVMPSSNPFYFWGQASADEQAAFVFPPENGYKEASGLFRDDSPQSWENVLNLGIQKLLVVFNSLDTSNAADNLEPGSVAEIKLSEELKQWRAENHKAGRKLPSKGRGLTRASPEVIELLLAQDWPPPLLTNSALFGPGITNMWIGAHDPEVLYSNYCNDVGFFYEHGYNKVFPEYEELLKQASSDSRALRTFVGTRRRIASDIGLKYTRAKIALEEESITKLAFKTAKVSRSEALSINFCESEIWGLAAEAMARGFDKPSVVHDFILSSPGTDVVDVGSDIHNSELFNSFLNTADITENGIVTEEILRRVYDAYAHSAARMLTHRWSDPGARLCAMMYVWHIVNNRHAFLRRMILGYGKVRKLPSPIVQREADFDEVFDTDLHTTGFSRPLRGACNGASICDLVEAQPCKHELLTELWNLLSVDLVGYAAKGVVCSEREEELCEALRLNLARCYSLGLGDESNWLVSHASHHAWQVNYLYEAAMFGGILDDGGLQGELDRFDGEL